MPWFVLLNEKPRGPLDASQLKRLAEQGQINGDTLVSQSTEGPWVAARKIKGLNPAAPADSLDPRTKSVASSSSKTSFPLVTKRSETQSVSDGVVPSDHKHVRRTSLPVRLALSWYRIPATAWLLFYGCLLPLLWLAHTLRESGIVHWRVREVIQPIEQIAGFTLLVVLLLTIFLRFYISQFCFPIGGDSFYVRVARGKVEGPFKLTDIYSRLAKNKSDYVALNRGGPFFFWVESITDEASEHLEDRPFWRKYQEIGWLFFELLPRLMAYTWFRVFRVATWLVSLTCLLLQLVVELFHITLPGADVLLSWRFAGVHHALFWTCLLDVILTTTSSRLGRSYIRQYLKNRATHSEESTRQQWEEKQRANEMFLKSGLFDPEPRISGLLMHVEGISCRNSATDTAEAFFRKDGISLYLPGEVSKTIPAGRVKSVVVGGRGDFKTSRDDMWVGGGFGVTGALKGAINAAALNYLTSLVTQKEHRECILVIKWDGGEVVLLNDLYEPGQAWAEIQRITKNYDAAQT